MLLLLCIGLSSAVYLLAVTTLTLAYCCGQQNTQPASDNLSRTLPGARTASCVRMCYVPSVTDLVCTAETSDQHAAVCQGWLVLECYHKTQSTGFSADDSPALREVPA